MKIEIIKCPSGWWAVLVNGMLFDGACKTEKEAEKIAEYLKEV